MLPQLVEVNVSAHVGPPVHSGYVVVALASFRILDSLSDSSQQTLGQAGAPVSEKNVIGDIDFFIQGEEQAMIWTAL